MNKEISCPGKINLFLDVTGKKDNGYHDILTLFLPISGIEDTITLTQADSLKVSCEHPDVPLDSKNLCWQAAEKFAAAAGIQSNWEIKINKKLPIAGGMGGGSSNAGCLLSLLDSTYPNKISKITLKEIALTIGADVPFFLNPRPSIAAGVGEDLKALNPREKIPILIITFSFPISAAWSYKNRKRPLGSSGLNADKLKSLWQADDIESIIYNDLGFAVEDKFPIIKGALEDLKEAGAQNAIVSGSGPTVFGVFNDDQSTNNALNKLLETGYPKENLIPALAG